MKGPAQQLMLTLALESRSSSFGAINTFISPLVSLLCLQKPLELLKLSIISFFGILKLSQFPSMASFSNYLDALCSSAITSGGIFVNLSDQICLGPVVIDRAGATMIVHAHNSLFLCTTLSFESISIDTVLGLKTPRNWPQPNKSFNS